MRHGEYTEHKPLISICKLLFKIDPNFVTRLLDFGETSQEHRTVSCARDRSSRFGLGTKSFGSSDFILQPLICDFLHCTRPAASQLPKLKAEGLVACLEIGQSQDLKPVFSFVDPSAGMFVWSNAMSSLIRVIGVT